MDFFYTPLAEWSKLLLYVSLALLVLIGVWKKQYRADPKWANWIHLAVFIHFLVGAFYSGVRMLTTNEVDDMLIRRIYACEVWFNTACGAFYFLFLEYINQIKSNKSV
jgi:hypothetical membrane protein